MMISLNQVGQVSLSVADVDEAERFYTGVLGVRKLFRFGGLLFLECAGLRVLVEKSAINPFSPGKFCPLFQSFRHPIDFE